MPAARSQAADAPPQVPRFRIDAGLQPLVERPDGRYAIDARARFEPEVRSADGRFALKSVNAPTVGCEPSPDPVFGNGFEAPGDLPNWAVGGAVPAMPHPGGASPATAAERRASSSPPTAE